jgi:hypothetical protein
LYNGKTFLAFTRGPHPANDGRSGDVKLELGVEYDIAAQIDQKNGWFEEGELDPEMVAMMIKVAARGLYELIHFCFAGRKLNEKGMQIAMRRFVAVAWMLHSEMLIGTDTDEAGEAVPLTLEQLGNVPQLDCTKVALSLLAKRFGEMFHFHARVQKRKTSKGNYAGAAKTGWVKRRARAKAAWKKENKIEIRARRQKKRRDALAQGRVPNDGYSGKRKRHHYNG